MDTGFKSFRNDINKIQNKNSEGLLLEYDQAIEAVREYLQAKIKLTLEENARGNNVAGIVVKDKEFLRERKNQYRGYIDECIVDKKIRVRGYQGERIKDFVNEMVDELAGYSILEDAFADPAVSDIYVLDWETIFVERNGENEKYPKKFRDAKHFENVVKRFLDWAGKEINAGDAKIVDFELYQDRGAATHPGVSPRGYTLTIRKHAEDHITRDQLVSGHVVDQKLIDLLGMLVMGETNLICAGLTGSGKTTTIRAILDYYVSKANKRMLVCEDTQELFPKNEHTLELVSVKSDDPKTAVPLQNLIYTALRLKPKYIVVGEVRGEEAAAAVEGMETGHSTIFTMHGGTSWNVINRLVTKYLMAMPSLGIDVVERIIGSGVDYIFVQDNIPGIGRKITTLTEIEYDFKTKRVSQRNICRFDFEKEEWVWDAWLGTEKIDKMLRRGIPLEQLRPWMKKTA